jgi:hypothetical protein
MIKLAWSLQFIPSIFANNNIFQIVLRVEVRFKIGITSGRPTALISTIMGWWRRGMQLL